MSEQVQNAEKTFTQKDIDTERANAQHFQQLYNEAEEKRKGTDKKVTELMGELDKLKNDAVVKNGDPKELEARIAEKEAEIRQGVQAEIDAATKRATDFEVELRRERAIKPAITQLAGMVTGTCQIELLEPILARDLDWQDGKIIVKDKDGKPRYSKTKATELMGIEEYFGELKGKYPTSFKAEVQSGGRSQATPIAVHNGTKVTSRSDLQKLPDKGKKLFQELAKTAEGRAEMKSIMSN